LTWVSGLATCYRWMWIVANRARVTAAAAEVLRNQQRPRLENGGSRPDQKASQPPLRLTPVVGVRLRLASTAKPPDGGIAEESGAADVLYAGLERERREASDAWRHSRSTTSLCDFIAMTHRPETVDGHVLGNKPIDGRTVVLAWCDREIGRVLVGFTAQPAQSSFRTASSVRTTCATRSRSASGVRGWPGRAKIAVPASRVAWRGLGVAIAAVATPPCRKPGKRS
jgi:hypothetical protein